MSWRKCLHVTEKGRHHCLAGLLCIQSHQVNGELRMHGSHKQVSTHTRTHTHTDARTDAHAQTHTYVTVDPLH